MNCPYCDTVNLPYARYCTNCGAELGQWQCHACRAENPGPARQCGRCGQPRLRTREEAPLAVQYAGFWIRVGAWIIDTIILLPVGVLATLVDLVAYPSGTLVYFLVAVLYVVLFTGLKGQTPGKMAVGIRVINERGDPPGIGVAALREILGKLVSAVALLLGYIWVAFDPQKRGWHDHIARTFVVIQKRGSSAVVGARPE